MTFTPVFPDVFKTLYKGLHIYIAGPVSDMEDFNRLAFLEAEERLRHYGAIPCSSRVLPEGWQQGTYMDICFAMIRGCQAIYMLKGWERSKGAKAEHAYAEKLGLMVYYES